MWTTILSAALPVLLKVLQYFFDKAAFDEELKANLRQFIQEVEKRTRRSVNSRLDSENAYNRLKDRVKKKEP